ncbi:MAG: protein TolR [Bdellovibrionales bacterium]|nr:protein TolR [Bdellovibrionales bacterium]
MGMSSSKNRSSMSEINVTPLVDVMLVLLIIFMVTAPMMQQGIDIDLPETAASGIETSDEPFVLTIRDDQKLYVAKEQVALKGLRKKLKAIFASRKNKQIYLKADKKVDYEMVAKTLAEIRAAGIYNIGLVTLPQ